MEMSIWIENVSQFFLNVKGASMATLTTDTLPKINKTNGQKGIDKKLFKDEFDGKTIHKIAIRHIAIGHRYATSVNNRVDKEVGEHEEIEPQPRTWGERIGKSVLFTHTTKDGSTNSYLEYFYLSANSPKSSHIYVWDNGKQLTESELQTAKTQYNLDPKKKISTTQSDAGLTDENAIIINQIKLENIVEIHAYGNTLTRV